MGYYNKSKKNVSIQIDREYFNEHLEPLLPQDSEIVKQAIEKLNYGASKFDLDVSKLSVDALDAFYELAKVTGNRSMMVQIAPLRKIMRDTKAIVTHLKAFPLGLSILLKENFIDGWLYHVDESGIPNPYLVRDIVYYEPNSVEERPSVSVHLVANNMRYSSGLENRSISVDSDDIHKKTLHEILASNNFYVESNELKEQYEENLRLFKEYQPQFNNQFWATGVSFSGDGRWYEREVVTGRSRVVNDEETVSRKFTFKVEAPYFWEEVLLVGKETAEVPFHTYIKIFNLSVHQNYWVHVRNLEPYVYDKTLKDKLVLPQSHRDLIDILVEDMDFLQDDMIEGKSGGTTILCTGKPGLGKTLSAEVYAEIIERPLYRVHSGQLGLTSDRVESNLETILKRAARWGAVLLLDEADVYIRVRGNDLEHNAVVASFLRTLEYFDGLMFMTTNRGDDVDDAILSRCIAIIKYETPSPEDALKLWDVLSTQFNVDIDYDLAVDLVEKFPSASGRDIKELLKLASKYAKGKGVALDMDVFRKCAQFRGVTFVE